jgi:hypothetical protein
LGSRVGLEGFFDWYGMRKRGEGRGEGEGIRYIAAFAWFLSYELKLVFQKVLFYN